jgi:phosphoglycerate dehydrogenase-like enzyme
MSLAPTVAEPSPSRPWSVAVHLTHPQVPAWCFGEAHAQRLQAALPGLTCRLCASRAEFRTALREAQVAFVWSFAQEEFAGAPALRLLATPAAGRDYFQVTPPPGVEVVYGRFHGEIMAETAVGMILAMARGLLPAVTTYRGDPWPRALLAPGLRPLRGAHVVILGFGHIGRCIGRLLKPFGVRISGIRRQPSPLDLADGFEARDRVLALADLDAVLPAADHLVLVLPGGAGTDALLSAARIGLLPPHATLINLGRGNALDEAALITALRAGRLAGACLDVFGTEPLPADSPLRSCPNLWLFPHVSAVSPTYLDLFVDDFVAQFQLRPQSSLRGPTGGRSSPGAHAPLSHRPEAGDGGRLTACTQVLLDSRIRPPKPACKAGCCGLH